MAQQMAEVSNHDPLPMAHQTELPSPIKVRLQSSTDARHELLRQAHIFLADGDDEAPYYSAAVPALNTERQKTNVVLRTREEVESILTLLHYSHTNSRRTQDAFDRFETEVRNEALRLGLDFEGDRYEADAVLIDGVRGQVPDSLDYECGEVLKVKRKHLYESCNKKDECDSVTVDMLGSEKVLVNIRRDLYRWVPHALVEGKNHELMERRQLRQSCIDKRKAADMEELLNLVKRHIVHWAEKVWTAGSVPAEDIEVVWNNRFSFLGGRYTRHTSIDGPKMELSPGLYYQHGLSELLETARHELIHAWQDYHPNGHPPDTHKHHGRDFHQWTDDLETSRYCKHYSE